MYACDNLSKNPDSVRTGVQFSRVSLRALFILSNILPTKDGNAWMKKVMKEGPRN
jgi:hypothetical protein